MLKIQSIIFLFAIFVAGLVQAYSSELIEKEYGILSITSNKYEIAIQFNLKEGWKTYADKKSKIGVRPNITIKSNKLKKYIVFYPHYEIEISNNLTSFVYRNNLTIPIKIELLENAPSEEIEVEFSYAVCKHSCLLDTIKSKILVGDLISDKESEKTISQLGKNNLFLILFYAFLGGLILNFMPCVLPVVSIKLLSIIKSSSTEVKINLLATIAGILTTFLSFAILTIILKKIGINVGIGQHFQEPVFLITMIIILVLMGCNLIGSYEFSIPNFILKNLQISPKNETIIGSFITGIVATILATPCTAPYLTVAISYAMQGCNYEIIMILICVGIGFSLPYFAVFFFPSFGKLLPKPGKWMLKFKFFLGILLFLSSIWLISILYKHLGLDAAIVVFMISILIKFSLENNQYFLQNTFGKAIAIIILIAFAYFLPFQIQKDEQNLALEIDSLWEKFDNDKIDNYIVNDKIVFVNVTADWCITCKLNKLLNLDRPNFIKLLRSGKVIGMTADITSSTPSEITKFMEGHKQYAIPLNVLYGPNTRDGIILPVTLFSNELEVAIKNAK